MKMVSFIDHASRIRLPGGCKLEIKRKNTMTSQFVDMTSSAIFFVVVVFLFLSLVTGLSFMSMSWLVLELWQFSFIKDWPEIRESKIPPNIWRLGRAIKSYWMLQNTFTVFEIIQRKPTGGKSTPTLPD